MKVHYQITKECDIGQSLIIPKLKHTFPIDPQHLRGFRGHTPPYLKINLKRKISVLKITAKQTILVSCFISY